TAFAAVAQGRLRAAAPARLPPPTGRPTLAPRQPRPHWTAPPEPWQRALTTPRPPPSRLLLAPLLSVAGPRSRARSGPAGRTAQRRAARGWVAAALSRAALRAHRPPSPGRPPRPASPGLPRAGGKRRLRPSPPFPRPAR